MKYFPTAKLAQIPPRHVLRIAVSIFLVATSIIMPPMLGHTQAQQAVQATLTWDDTNPPGLVTAYQMQRKEGAGAYNISSTVPAGTKTVQETLPGGGTYCWRVLAVAGETKSLPSNEVCKTLLVGPINLSVTITGPVVISVP